MTEAITLGPVAFISIAGRVTEALAAVEVMCLEIAGTTAAFFFDGFTLCSAAEALGGGAVNLSFSLRPWTTWTTRMVAPPIKRTCTRMLMTRKLPLQDIHRCQRERFMG
jgi:hypothetical protein